jgi:signal peptidase I
LSFALFLFLLLVVTGVVWGLDAAWLQRRRPAGAKQPWWVEYSASFFPVILIVFVMRSFIVEPFKIPSSSMVPTLLVGDFILVNKFTYGIRLPVIDRKIVSLGFPQRGDVMVFRYPDDSSLDYIKRVVGLPGETVEVKPYDGVYINGERLDEPYYKDVPNYTVEATVVPTDSLFVLGDNRRNSSDSHLAYNGPVPLDKVAGHAWISYWPLNSAGLLPHPTYATEATPTP